jgi:hypothetical protein
MLIEQFLIYLLCVIGVGITSHNIGVRKGAGAMFDSMCELGELDAKTKQIIITVDQDG